MFSKQKILDRCEKSETGCWLWQLVPSNRGYGTIGVGSRTDGTRRNIHAHRYSYEAFVGPIGDKHVLHKCDNPLCVNPNHLFLGYDIDNVRDMLNKGRGNKSRGQDHKWAKIDESTARRIKFLLSRNVRHRDIANGLGVGLSTVKHISAGNRWRHIEEPDNE